MDMDNLIQTTLRGNPFIAKVIQDYTDPNDEVYGVNQIMQCDMCFYREGPTGKISYTCHRADKATHITFGLKTFAILPKLLDGKQVGNYCPHYLSFGAE